MNVTFPRNFVFLIGLSALLPMGWDAVAGPAAPVISDPLRQQEIRWSTLENLMRMQGDDLGASVLTGSEFDNYRFWREFTLQLIADSGWQYYSSYPNDPRRWQWVEFEVVFRRGPMWLDTETMWQRRLVPSVQVGFEAARRNAWNARMAVLTQACADASDAPSGLRCTCRCLILQDKLERTTKGPGNQSAPDLQDMARELAKIGSDFPHEEISTLRSLASTIIRRADKISLIEGEAVRATLKLSPNSTIRAVAESGAFIEKAKSTPIDLKFTAMDGREVDMTDLRGHVVLVEFRGVTWCGWCREEEPFMKDAYRKYHDRGFEILTITYEQKPGSRDFVTRYMKAHELIWPVYFDGLGAKNPFVQKFGVTAVPMHFLFDREGLLVSTSARGEQLAPLVEKYLDRQQ